jgi:hypothetical protein
MLQYDHILLVFPTFPCTSQKLPATAGFCIFINMYTSCLFFQITVTKSPLTLVFITLKFDFASYCQSPQHVIKLIWKGEQTVHVKFVAYPFYSHRKTSYCCLCSCHRLCCNFSFLSEAYLDRLYSLEIFISKCLYFLKMYCLKITHSYQYMYFVYS